MNKLLLICLLGLSLPVNALTKQELICASQNIYFEAREDKASWLKVLQVANNRKSNPKKYGAKSSHLCDIVHSKQYSTRRFKRIKEPQIYKEISIFVKRYQQLSASSIVYFRSKHGVIKFRSKA